MSGEIESVERREFLEAGKEKRELEECQKTRREDEHPGALAVSRHEYVSHVFSPAHQHYEAHQGKDPHFTKLRLKGKGKETQGKPWLPRPVLSVLISARKPQTPSVRGNRDSWSLSLPLSLPPAPPPASSLRNKPCQSPGGLPPTHPLLAGSGGRGSSDLRLPEPLCSRVQGWPCTSSLPAPQRLPDVAPISQH